MIYGCKMKNKKQKIESFSNIIFVWKLLYKSNKKLYYVRIPLLLLQTISSLVTAYFLRLILNSLTLSGSIKEIMFFSFGMAFTNFFVALIAKAISNYDQLQVEKTKYNIKLMLGESVSRMPLSEIENPRMKDFISLAENNNAFTEIIDYSTGFVGAAINVATYLSIVFTVQPLLIFLIVAVTVFQITIDKYRRRHQYKWRRRRTPEYRKLFYYMDVLSNFAFGKELRVNQLKNFFSNKANEQFEKECMPIIKKNNIEANSFRCSVDIINSLQNLAIYILLAIKVVFGGMLIGDFSMCLSCTQGLINYLLGLIGCYSNLITCGAFAKEFRYCIETSKCCNDNKLGNSDYVEKNNLSVEFLNVSFKYPNTNHYVLKNLSFKIHAGEHLSLVGVNGSGKSTIVKLICGFYLPTTGDIFVGGANTKNISREEYAKILSAVFQDYKLFSFTIKENISMNISADEKKLLSCVDNSDLSDKIKLLNQGINTYVYKDFDENGIEFSGGEGQKLAIARALYKDTPLIILDEPTAALDPIAEYKIYESLERLTSGKTAIFISHRLSMTRFADKIAVMKDGELCEYGTHDELIIKENGIYSSMFNAQAQYYR